MMHKSHHTRIASISPVVMAVVVVVGVVDTFVLKRD